MKSAFHLRNLVPALGGFALVFAAACGSDDNGNGNGNDVDADLPGIDADVNGTDDADVDVAADRTGTVALTETRILAADGLGSSTVGRGATTRIEFLDAEPPAPGDGCTVTPVEGPDQVDEGPITVTGTQVGDEDGSFTCAFDDAVAGYVCTLAADDAATMVLRTCTGGPGGTCLSDNVGAGGTGVELVLVGDDLVDDDADTTHNLIGSRVALEGFDADTADDGPYLVLDQAFDGGDSILTIALPDDDVPSAPEDETGEDAGSYEFTIGHGPELGQFTGDEQIFLVGEDTDEDEVTVAKQDGDNLDAFDVSAFPLGQGMALAGGELEIEDEDDLPLIQPFDFLTDDDHLGGVAFSCASDVGDGEGVCAPDTVDLDDVSGLTAFAVTGVAVNGGEDQTVAFSCQFIGKQTGIIDAETIAQILAIEPDEITTNVTYGNGSLEIDATGNRTSVIVGNTLVGIADSIIDPPSDD